LAQLLPDASCGPHLAYLKEWWSDVLQEWPLERFDALPTGWLHGDFHGRNLVFEGDRVAGIFDLDDVDRGPYVHDVATGLMKFGRERRGSLTIRPEFACAFVSGYEQVRPLSPDEAAALPVMISEGFPPHAHNYRYWRDRRDENIMGRFVLEVAIMKALAEQAPGVSRALDRRVRHL
jgi:Ser/Thr protein kinase RdoA (MazF antagonist)